MESSFKKIHHFPFRSPVVRWFNPPKELTSTCDAWYTWIFGMRVLSRTVEDDVVETAEGLPTKKHRKVSQSTITYYSVLQRTATYKVLRRTMQYLQLHTRKYYAVLLSIPPYYKVLLRTIQSTRLLMHLAWKNTTFRAPALSQEFDQILRLPRKVRLQNHQILRLSRKITLQNHQMARVPSKVTLQHHQMLVLPQKKCHRFLSWLLLYCFFPDWPAPFLNYSIPFLNLSFTEYSFTGHFLDWTIPFWTVPLLSLPLMKYTFTHELVLSSTQLYIPLLNYALILLFKPS